MPIKTISHEAFCAKMDALDAENPVPYFRATGEVPPSYKGPLSEEVIRKLAWDSEPIIIYKIVPRETTKRSITWTPFWDGFFWGVIFFVLLVALAGLIFPTSAHAATDIPLEPAFRASGFEQTDENINVFARILRGNGWACGSLIQITTFTPGQQWGVVCDHGRHVYRLTLYYGKVLIEPGVF
ncbi:MAG: hypothetical protein V4447_10720 [Pseudomonadota bacterium]